MKTSLLTLTVLALLGAPAALAAPLKLQNVPVTVDTNPRLYVLNDAGIARAFPSAAGRPEAVFLTEDRKVTIAFDWREAALAPAGVASLTNEFATGLRAQVPNLKTIRSAAVQVGGHPWGQIIFTTPGQGDDRRFEMLLTSAGGRLLVVTVASNVKDYSRNENLVRNLASSLRVN
ncbi:hypothetical protein QOL99_16960 [Deinococcus sp. MIMF12]|uniref:DUF1795 domain-containing protein n=1 Tax=Deinococcus rhizophilus TaxID=3049544 RepID=A0ABT7JLK2_9DEIO|nr:hypothetical protein [Deinococcus rhizophilus]MDL2345821.1 hypothetical protein [Deinococcus rhizophilus]